MAHRGNARECPENTLPAFQSALDLGARFLELDVQLAADGTPVVLHDDGLLRTTGQTGVIFDLTPAELAAFDACEPVRLGAKYRGTRVPLLADVLALLLLNGRPDVTLFVEIKEESIGHFGREHVVSRVVEVLRPQLSQCIVISFDLDAVIAARRLGAPKIGWVLSRYDEASRARAEELALDVLFCDRKSLPRSGPLWTGPWRWAIYEVVSPDEARALAARGVALIETMAVREMTTALRAGA